MADRAAAELEHHVLAEIGQELVHLTGMDAARGDRHHLAQPRPVLLEEQAALEVDQIERLPQDVVEALHHVRVTLELADHGARVDVVDPGQPHPLGNHAERDAVVLLARVGGVRRRDADAGSCRSAGHHFDIDWIAV